MKALVVHSCLTFCNAMGYSPPCSSVHGISKARILVFIVQLLSRVQFFVTPWTAACQASLSFTIYWSLLKLMSIELGDMIPSNCFILFCPLLLLPSFFPSIRVFSNESALRIRWPKYWSFSSSISPSNECSGLLFWKYILDEWTLYTNRTGMTG